MKSLLPSKQSLELTLAILKPHLVKATHALEGIHKIIAQNNFLIVKSSIVRISDRQIEKFYHEHKQKFFYNRLITSMMSGDCEVFILAKTNAIKDWRRLMGPTRVYEAIFSHPDSIRGLYGLTDTRNATHGSDSLESATREIGVFFPDFNVSQWLAENGSRFDEKLVKSDQSHLIRFSNIDSCKRSAYS